MNLSQANYTRVHMKIYKIWTMNYVWLVRCTFTMFPCCLLAVSWIFSCRPLDINHKRYSSVLTSHVIYKWHFWCCLQMLTLWLFNIFVRSSTSSTAVLQNMHTIFFTLIHALEKFTNVIFSHHLEFKLKKKEKKKVILKKETWLLKYNFPLLTPATVILAWYIHSCTPGYTT